MLVYSVVSLGQTTPQANVSTLFIMTMLFTEPMWPHTKLHPSANVDGPFLFPYFKYIDYITWSHATIYIGNAFTHRTIPLWFTHIWTNMETFNIFKKKCIQIDDMKNHINNIKFGTASKT